MSIEICFPKNNEEKFIEIAEKLNIKQLYFIYIYQKNIDAIKNNIKELQTKTKIKLLLGIQAEPNKIQAAKHLCNFVITNSSEKDQQVMENLKPNLIYNLENSGRKDKTHYRISGLNQVLCKLAVKNNIIIANSFSNLLNSTKEKRAVLFGRIIQNLRFCKKYKCETLLASFAKQPSELRNPQDLESLKRILK